MPPGLTTVPSSSLGIWAGFGFEEEKGGMISRGRGLPTGVPCLLPLGVLLLLLVCTGLRLSDTAMDLGEPPRLVRFYASEWRDERYVSG